MTLSGGSSTVAAVTNRTRGPGLNGISVRLRTASPTDNFKRARQIGFQSLQSGCAIFRAERLGRDGIVYQCAERRRGQSARTIALGISSYSALWRYLQREGRSREYGIFYGPPR
jgi:hypothetical protein